MANIIWSFGIALNAQDQASGPINDVIGSLSTMERTLSGVNERLIEHTNLMRGMAQSYAEVAEDIGRFNGFDQLRAETDDSLGAGLDAFESYITGGLSTIVKGVGSVLSTVVGAVVSTISTIASTAFTIVSKTVTTTLSAAWSLAKGTASVVKSVLLSPLTLIKTLLDTGTLLSISDSVERFLSLGNSFAPIDRDLRQLSAQMGLTKADATKLIDTVVQMGVESGLSVRNMSDLAVALGRTGHNLSQIKPDVAKTLGHIAETFGLGAEETARFNSAAQRVGINIKQLAGEAIVFGEKFGIPGLMRVLPEVTNHAAEAISRFSKTVVGNQKQLIETTLRTGAIYSKAFGKDITEATSMAQATFEGFAGAAQQNQDVMLGLSDAISPLSMALLQGGANWQDMNQIISEGQRDPIVAADHMRQLINSMAPGPAQERFKRLLQKELPEGMRQLVFDNAVYQRALKEQAFAQTVNSQAIQEGTKSFDDMAESMRDNFGTLNLVIENMKTGLKALFGALFTDTFRTSLKDVAERFSVIGKNIGNLVAQVKATPAFEKLQAVVGKIGTYFIAAGKGAGTLAQGLMSISTITSVITPLTAILTGAIGVIERAFSGKSFSLTNAIKVMFTEAQEYVRGKLAQWNTEIPANLSETFSNAGATVGARLGEIAKSVTDFIQSLFNEKDRAALWDRLTGLFKGTESEKDSITTSFLGIASKVIDAVRGFVTEFAQSFLGAYGTNIQLFTKNVSLTFKEFVNTASDSWVSLKSTFITVFNTMLPIIQGFSSGVLSVADGLIEAAHVASDAANILDMNKLAAYQASINEKGIIGNLSGEEEREYNALVAKENARQANFNKMQASIQAAKSGVNSLKEIDATTTSTPKQNRC